MGSGGPPCALGRSAPPWRVGCRSIGAADRLTRMRKWAGRFFAGLSLLLLVGTVGMWAASQWVWTQARRDVWIGAGRRAVVHHVRLDGFRESLKVEVSSCTYDFSDPA